MRKKLKNNQRGSVTIGKDAGILVSNKGIDVQSAIIRGEIVYNKSNE